MSRSHKHFPLIKGCPTVGKRLANRKIRRKELELPNNGGYKKYYYQYDISDYTFIGFKMKDFKTDENVRRKFYQK